MNVVSVVETVAKCYNSLDTEADRLVQWCQDTFYKERNFIYCI